MKTSQWFGAQGETGQKLDKAFTVKMVEPGIVEFRCRKCGNGFEPDTTVRELLCHEHFGIPMGRR
jgi:hypothetical protein